MNKENLISSLLTSFIPILYLVNILLSYLYRNTYQGPFELVITGVILTYLGLTFWIISFINLRKYFGVLPQKQRRIKTGLYRYFKHPMYIGIFLTFLGLSLSNQSLQSLIFLFVVMTPLLIIRTIFEEKKLIKR